MSCLTSYVLLSLIQHVTALVPKIITMKTHFYVAGAGADPEITKGNGCSINIQRSRNRIYFPIRWILSKTTGG